MPINVGDLFGSLSLEDQLSQTIDRIHAKLTLAGVDFDDLNKKVVTASTTMGQAANVQTVLQSELAKVSVRVNSASGTLNELAKTSLLSASAARQLEPQMQAVAKELLVAKSASDALKSSMGLMNNEFNSVKEAAKITSAQIVSLGRGVQEVGVVFSTLFTAPLVAAGAAVIHFSGEFEKAMNKASILGGLTAKEMKEFEGTVLDIGQAMGVAPAQVAVGLDIIGSAMYKGAEAADILTRATKMSALGMGTVEETTRAVVGAMLTFKNENLTAAQASDMLLKTVQVGNMKIADLVGSLAKVNPLAAALGVHFSDVNAAIATFTHLGAPAEVAGTGVRAVLSNILNDSIKTEKGLKGLGISMVDLQKHIKEDLVGALIDLVETADKLPDGMARLNQVFPNIRALTLVLADAKAQGKQFRTIGDDIKHAGGSIDVAMTQLRNTWTQQWNEMTTAVQVFAIQFGNELMPTLKSFVGFVKNDILPVVGYLLDIFKNLPDPVKTIIFGVAALTAAVGPLLIVAGELIRSWGHLSVLWKGDSIIKMMPSLQNFQTEMKATELATKAATVSLIAFNAAVSLPAIWDFLKEIKKLNDTGMEQYKIQLEELRTRHLALAEATKIAKHPITDLDEAIKIIANDTQHFRDESAKITADLFVGPMEQYDDVLVHTTFSQDLLAAAMEVSKTSVSLLRPEVVGLTKDMFQHGMTSAEAFKILKSHNLVLDEQKVAIENLHDSYVKEAKILKDIADANTAVAMALIPLTKAQREEADELLAIGVGHETIADKINAHITQVQALVKSKANEKAALKSELEGINDITKAWMKNYEETQLLGATDSEKVRIKAMADYDIHIKLLQDKGVQDVKYYDQAWALMQKDIENAERARLLKDTKSKSHLLLQIEQEKELYQFMIDHSNEYTKEDRANQKVTIEGLKNMRDHWGEVGNVVAGVTSKIKQQSVEMISMFDAAKKFNDSIVKTPDSFTQDITGQITPITDSLEHLDVNVLERKIRELSAKVAGYIGDTKSHALYGIQEIASANKAFLDAVQQANDVKQLEYLEKMLNLAKDAQAVTESMGKQICACGDDSNGSTVGSSNSVAGGGGVPKGFFIGGGAYDLADQSRIQPTVRVEPGAIVLQYPIMRDRAAMSQLGHIAGDAVIQRLIDQGWKPPRMRK